MRFLLLALMMGASLPLGAATQVDLVAVEQDTQAYLAALRRLGLGEHVVPPGQALPTRLRVHLHRADAATARQATAHALGAWWTTTEGGTIYRSDLELPRERLISRSYTSALVGDGAWEAVVRELLSPWLAVPGSGIAFDPGSGLWVATLDGDGQRRLVALIGLIERREPNCPSSIPHPLAALPLRSSVGRITAQTWGDLADRLVQQLGVSISRSGDLPLPPAVIDLPPGTLVDHQATLARLRVASTWIDGVWCWGASEPVRRAHPAQQSRFALLPTVHITDDTSGHLLATALGRATFGALPGPGQRVHYVPALRALLASGEPADLHRLWDRLERAEREGMAAALAEEGP